jgi:hypothetical protein
MAYDKGSIGQVLPLGHGRYRVESFKERGSFYEVDLNPSTFNCSCPFHKKKLVEEWGKGKMLDVECKEKSKQLAYEKAMRMEPEEIRHYLQNFTHRPEVSVGMNEALRQQEIQKEMEQYSCWPFLWIEEAA